ncbi:hypothetical protein evm_010105 [Chilo suppressalis]|nr:hypothetical protein evm_010105 [Chilo suppressalis]
MLLEITKTAEKWRKPTAASRPPLIPEETGQSVRKETGVMGGGLPPATGTPLPSTSARHHQRQSTTPLPLTPRRRRRVRLIDPSSPIQRRTRTQTQSDLARQAFVISDCEWRAFQQETERERNRLRELELRNQERWLELFGKSLILGNRVVDILERNGNRSKLLKEP